MCRHRLSLIADVAQPERHQRWSVSCKCACAVTASVVTAHAQLHGVWVVQHLLLVCNQLPAGWATRIEWG